MASWVHKTKMRLEKNVRSQRNCLYFIPLVVNCLNWIFPICVQGYHHNNPDIMIMKQYKEQEIDKTPLKDRMGLLISGLENLLLRSQLTLTFYLI